MRFSSRSNRRFVAWEERDAVEQQQIEQQRRRRRMAANVWNDLVEELKQRERERERSGCDSATKMTMLKTAHSADDGEMPEMRQVIAFVCSSRRTRSECAVSKALSRLNRSNKRARERETENDVINNELNDFFKARRDRRDTRTRSGETVQKVIVGSV
jgi:hypothetical protein